MFYLKEDTAADIKLGPFVNKDDGVTYEVGMAAAMDHADTGVRLSKNGGAFADRNEGTEPTYDAFGYYLVKLDTTDTNTPGTLKVIFGAAATCLPCEANFQVVAANVYDSLYAAATTDYLDVNVVALAADVITPASVDEDADFVIQALSVTNQLDAGSVVVDGTTTLTGAVGTGAITAATLSVTGQLDAGSVLVDAGMDVVGALSANSLLIDTTTTLTGNVSMGGTLGVTGITTFTGAVNANITGDITGNLSGSVGTCAAATVSAIGNNVITAASIADAAIDNATFAADVDAGIAAMVWDTASAITLDFGTLLERAYQILNNKMLVTDATGIAALRNLADDADIATGKIEDAAGTTTRAVLTWV